MASLVVACSAKQPIQGAAQPCRRRSSEKHRFRCQGESTFQNDGHSAGQIAWLLQALQEAGLPRLLSLDLLALAAKRFRGDSSVPSNAQQFIESLPCKFRVINEAVSRTICHEWLRSVLNRRADKQPQRPVLVTTLKHQYSPPAARYFQ